MEIQLINWFHLCLGCLAIVFFYCLTIVCYEIVATNVETEQVPLKFDVFVYEKI